MFMHKHFARYFRLFLALSSSSSQTHAKTFSLSKLEYIDTQSHCDLSCTNDDEILSSSPRLTKLFAVSKLVGVEYWS